MRTAILHVQHTRTSRVFDGELNDDKKRAESSKSLGNIENLDANAGLLGGGNIV